MLTHTALTFWEATGWEYSEPDEPQHAEDQNSIKPIKVFFRLESSIDAQQSSRIDHLILSSSFKVADKI